MILSIHQPSYFPWLGLLDKIAKSDVYMVMDEVQLSDSAFQHRNLFLTADGKSKFLTISFNKKDYQHRRFCDLEITQPDWQKKHLEFIKNGYKKHPFYYEIMERLEPIFEKKYCLLVDVVVDSMLATFELFNIRTKIIFQSQLDYDRSAHKGDLVMALIRAVGADCYLSGTGAQAYLDESAFGNGIDLKINRFNHPRYSQKNAAEFVPGLASIDVLMNLGSKQSAELLKAGGVT